MENRRLQRPRKGDPITAEWAAALVDMVIRNDIRVGGGLNMQKTANGTVLSATGRDNAHVGKTSSAISARVGTAPGTGTVTPQSFDGTNLAADGDDVTVYTYSGTALLTGKYCWYELGEGGVYWVISVEC